MPDDEMLRHLAGQLGEMLVRAHQRVATAESCTGGFAGKVMTDIPGSSQWFDRGFITYTNQSKTELLGVPAELIAEHGAVSEATARSMATGVLRHSQAQISLAVTGIAGPGGGRLDKPVGTVWFAWASRNGQVETESHWFPGDRDAVRRQAVAHALRGVMDRIG
ncbi:MAG: CinA family protein [Gammaproteobacteria bacterium]